MRTITTVTVVLRCVYWTTCTPVRPKFGYGSEMRYPEPSADGFAVVSNAKTFPKWKLASGRLRFADPDPENSRKPPPGLRDITGGLYVFLRPPSLSGSRKTHPGPGNREGAVALCSRPKHHVYIHIYIYTYRHERRDYFVQTHPRTMKIRPARSNCCADNRLFYFDDSSSSVRGDNNSFCHRKWIFDRIFCKFKKCRLIKKGLVCID